ncbi:MAG: cob(I)yrinic acid a,c-diamide adenosyltransferase [Planctomycetes bacterium]|nr:cob(I)yrinic acid a,c-diamide adenosyltransferase [Planctomycetota bacterium]
MVYLSRIYTRSGDAGETTLGDGSRVAKTHPRIAAYGGVDELNAVLGVAIAAELPRDFADRLRRVQNDLFDLGADLCVPESPDPAAHQQLRMTAAQVTAVECWIDEVNEKLTPLTSFVLPGGTAAAAHLHQARTVCRRVEIGVLELAGREPINPQVPIYLNRLSDLLFVLARAANAEGPGDVLWKPGGG